MAPLLSLFLLALMMLANNARSQGDVTSFWVDSFANLTYQRDAFIPPQLGIVRLIGTDSLGRPRPRSFGRVLYSTPVTFWEPGKQASFVSIIQFHISTVPSFSPADGMTFFIIPVNSTLAEPPANAGWGGDLGIFNTVVPGARIFAVEFDIYVNPEFDPNFRHIGINIDNKTSANVTRFEDAVGQTVTARIRYDAPTRRTEVVATYGSRTATVSYVHDLKTLLPQQVQVGISASVGPTQAALFDVLAWRFSSTLARDGGNNNVDVM